MVPSSVSKPAGAAGRKTAQGMRPAKETMRKHDQLLLERARNEAVRVALIASAVVFVLLVTFILQNGQTVKVSFLGLAGHMPLAIAMLCSAAGGALLVGIPWIAKSSQLRRNVRRQRD